MLFRRKQGREYRCTLATSPLQEIESWLGRFSASTKTAANKRKESHGYKFVLLYHGGKPPENDEEKDKVMAAWGAWSESLGDALVDIGNPLGPPQFIGGDAADAASGYSLLEAPDQETAVKLASSNPMASEDGTRIDVHEAFSM